MSYYKIQAELILKQQWSKCKCGSPVCKREYPNGIGTYYAGSGFDPEEKELFIKAFEALAEK